MKFSVVIPVYNEEDNVVILSKKLITVMESFKKDFEIIFIDDGSIDSTFNQLKEIHEGDSRFKVYKLRCRQGQSAAFSLGFLKARGEIIISMDGDLQNDPEDIPALLEKLEKGYDFVTGWRKHRKEKQLLRITFSKTANWLLRKITGLKIHDFGCSIRVYKAGILKKIQLYSELHRYLPFIIEIEGGKIAELPVRHHARLKGKSKYGFSRIWKVLLDIFVLRLLISLPSRFMYGAGIIGISLFVLSIVTLFFIFKGELHPVVPFSPVVKFTIFFLLLYMSLHFFVLSVFSQMFFKYYKERSKKIPKVNLIPEKI